MFIITLVWLLSGKTWIEQQLAGLAGGNGVGGSRDLWPDHVGRYFISL